MRLRDLGGIIVLDFIDMEEKKNRQKVAQAVEQELRKDRAPSKAVQVSDFGLIIITRKRVKSSLERQLTEPCPYCSGTGTIKTSATICYDILTEVKKVSADLDGYSLVLRVNPEIARALQGREPQRVPGARGDGRPSGDRAVRRAAAPRAVRFDGDLVAIIPEGGSHGSNETARARHSRCRGSARVARRPGCTPRRRTSRWAR